MSRLIKRLFRLHAPTLLIEDEYDDLLHSLGSLVDQQEKDRVMLEHSMHVMSDELQEINEQLRQQLAEQKVTQRQLKESLAKQQTLLDNTPEAIFHFAADNASISRNKSADDLLDRYPILAANLIPKDEQGWLQLFNSEPQRNEKIEEIFSDNLSSLKGIHETEDGCHFEYDAHNITIEGRNEGRILRIREITNFIKNQKQLEFQAYHDTLTLLPNRAYVRSSLSRFIQKADKTSRIAVLTIDIDDFKKINDTAGHIFGDRFLVRISDKLNSIIGKKDVLGRVGGDEFLVVMSDVKSQRQIISLHKEILKIFEEPFEFGETAFRISCSIGISLFSQDDSTADGLIQKSNLAMQKAKSMGKNTFHYYDHSLERIAHHRVEMELRLAEAIKNDELCLYFQPKVNLNTGNIVGAEALIRWIPREGQQIFPDQFIPLAEENGMIKEITRWVLDRACRYLVAWQDTELADIPVSINVSALDLADKEFSHLVGKTVKKYGLSPKLIEFELTESALYKDADLAKIIVQELRTQGFRLALDDFGTGFSSLSYLQELEVDILKIDKSFVQGMTDEPKRYSIVKSIIDVGTNLGLSVVSEGVETEIERSTLFELGNTIGQGYLFSRPVPESELIDFVAGKNSLTNENRITSEM